MKNFIPIIILMHFTSIGFSQKLNFVKIEPSDNLDAITRKAANVVPSARQLRWQKLELTAFFHFGVNTYTNREWGEGTEDEKIFNPVKLDTRQWVKACKDAGIKQVIITAKHHDGFCLWPSKYTEHSVKNSPWKNCKGDVVLDLSKACKEYGMGIGVYLSPWDRNSPYYGTEKYHDYFVNQLTELLTQYGKIDEVWFDGANGEGPNGKKQVYDFDRWFGVIRKLQPNAVIFGMGPDVRWVGTESGHGRETEWSVVSIDQLNPDGIFENSQQNVAFKPVGDMTDDDLGSRNKIKYAKALVWYPAETDVSIRPGWFYHPAEDLKVKSPETLKEIYFHSVGRNGVLLLNIPPNKDGLLSENDVNALKNWRKLLDKIFKTNLLKESVEFKTENNFRKLVDDNNETDYKFVNFTQGKIINFVKPVQFNIFTLQENISKGQRVKKFVLENWTMDHWEIVAEGTTIGYKRIITIPKKVESKKMRFRILKSRLTPNLADLGLYFDENANQK